MSELARQRRRFGVSLRELLALVTFLAVTFAALKFASYLWLTVVASVAFCCFCAATILAVLQRGPQQAFAIGFTLIGLGYLVLVFYVWDQQHDSVIGAGITARMGTTELLELLYTHVIYERQQLAGQQRIDRGIYGLGPTGGPVTVFIPDHETYMRIGQTLWALALGYLGGRFARHVWVGRNAVERRPNASRDPPGGMAS